MRAAARDQTRFLSPVDRSERPDVAWPPSCTELWRSRGYLLQVHRVPGHPGVERLSVCRSDQSPKPITWDTLQRLKRECGRGHLWAVEVYPADDQLVDVADMRHLWVVARPAWAW